MKNLKSQIGVPEKATVILGMVCLWLYRSFSKHDYLPQHLHQIEPTIILSWGVDTYEAFPLSK